MCACVSVCVCVCVGGGGSSLEFEILFKTQSVFPPSTRLTSLEVTRCMCVLHVGVGRMKIKQCRSIAKSHLNQGADGLLFLQMKYDTNMTH